MALPAVDPSKKTGFGGVSSSSPIVRKEAKSEGPILTHEEKQRFFEALSGYGKTQEGSEERVIAIRDALPTLLRGYRNKKQETGLTSDDEYFLKLVAGRIANMITELVNNCALDDPHITYLAFDVLKSLESVKPVVQLAKECPSAEIRQMAVQALIDRGARDSTKGSTMRIGGTSVPVTAYYKGLLVDIAENGTFENARSMVVAHFSAQEDLASLDAIRRRSRFDATKRDADRSFAHLQKSRLDDDKFAEEAILRLFGHGKLTLVSPANTNQPSDFVAPVVDETKGSEVVNLGEYRRRVEGVPPRPPAGGAALSLPDDPTVTVQPEVRKRDGTTGAYVQP